MLERKLTFIPADFLGIILLARQGTGYYVGFLGRRHGSPDTFCEPFTVLTIHDQVVLRVNSCRFSPTDLHWPQFPTRSRRRSKHTERAYSLPGRHSSSSSITPPRAGSSLTAATTASSRLLSRGCQRAWLATPPRIIENSLPHYRIFWPFGGDQPLNAILCAEKHETSYELLEVRSGHGLRPICRTGYTPSGTIDAVKAEARDVLTNAFGKDGAAKRERLQALRKAVLGEWEEGGASRRDVEAFLNSL